jgi:hypothetical protein
MDETSLSPAAPVAAASYTDRSTGLIVFGVILIILGLFALMFIPLALLGAMMARKVNGGGMPLGYNLLNTSVYAVAGIVFLCLGVGSIQARRWGRDLTLVTSCLWLAYGILGTIMLTAVLPSTFLAGFRMAAAQNPKAGPVPAGVMAVILTLMIAFFAFFLVVLPVIFVAFYRRADVAETCRHRDAKPRWTEKCPLPLLAVCVLFTFGALYYFLMAFAVPVYPFFGRYLTGLPAGLALLTAAALEAVLVALFYKKQIVGWWIAIFVLLFRCAAMGFTFGHANLLDAYAKLGMSGRQLDMLRANPMFSSGLIMWWGVVYIVPFLAYLIWTRRYFTVQPAALSEPYSPSLP